MQKFTETVIKDGKPIQGLTVSVTNYPAGTPATIYSSTGAAVDSVLTDANGRLEFYAPNGRYSVTVSGAGINPYTLPDIVLFDPADNGALAVKTSGGITVQAAIDSKAPADSPILTGPVTASAIRTPAGPLSLSIGDTERVRLDASGNLLVGATIGTKHVIAKPVVAGANILDVIPASGFGTYLCAADAAGFNGSGTTMFIGKLASTNRSINAAGTVNASGADYAEYMTKADGCGVLAKGAIVGVDAAGKLTDKWAEAVSFMVKSTDPSYVGGDTWGSESMLGMMRPVEPAADAHPDAHASYEQALAEFNSVLEQARQKVDRIAFCGQVPVNVTGAKPGEFILPDNGGTPWDLMADPEVPAWFKKFVRSVGVVQNILPDGRANVRVKVV